MTSKQHALLSSLNELAQILDIAAAALKRTKCESICELLEATSTKIQELTKELTKELND